MRHRPPGRLMRPSDYTIHGHGLGELDGILDNLKAFGSGIVQFATGGLYDPRKNRFYVPFSSGQMRNFAQGFVNTHTLGLVRTDKFFNSQTIKTVGTVAGAVAAAATAGVAAKLAVGAMSSGATGVTSAVGTGTSSVATTAAKTVATTAVKTVAEKSTSSLFTLDNITKALDVTSKVANVAGKVVGGGGAPQQQIQGGGAPVVVVGGGGGGEMYPAALPGSFPPDTYSGLYSPSMYSSSGGGAPMMMASGGGGGGIGPPGSEYYVAEDGTVAPVDSATKDIPLWVIIGSGVVLTYVLMSSKKAHKR